MTACSSHNLEVQCVLDLHILGMALRLKQDGGFNRARDSLDGRIGGCVMG